MRLDARIQTLRLAETFRIARSSQDEAETVVVAIEHDGVTGYGEAAPIDRYEESAASALAYAQEAAGALGDDPFALDEILDRLPRREWAARAAIDGALHDLQGKLLDVPTWRQLGLRRPLATPAHGFRSWRSPSTLCIFEGFAQRTQRMTLTGRVGHAA